MKTKPTQAARDEDRDILVKAGELFGEMTEEELVAAVENIRDKVHEGQMLLALAGVALAVKQANERQLHYWSSALKADTETADWFSGMNPEPPEHLKLMAKL